MKGFLVFACLIMLCNFSVFGTTRSESAITPPSEEVWELSKEKNNVKVYTRSREGTDIKEFKAITIISAKISDLVRIINDLENYPKWMTNCESATIIKTVNDSVRINYMKTSVPWPLADRDAVFEFKVIHNTLKHFEAIMQSVPDQFPVQEDIIRLTNTKGKWRFKEIESGMVEILYQFYGDPEGNIPTWIINLFIVDGPYETLLNLKNLCS